MFATSAGNDLTRELMRLRRRDRITLGLVVIGMLCLATALALAITG